MRCHFILGIFSLLLFFSCDKSNEKIPSYIQIDNIEVTTNLIAQGSNSHNIQDIWVYADGNLIGAFNLPATIPILEEGSTEIIIDPGIRDNGISSQPRIYPYYSRYSTTIDLVPGEVLSLLPSITYESDVEFVFIEDFEGSNLFSIDRDDDDQNTLGMTQVNAFEGTSGIMNLSTDHPIVEIASNLSYSDLPLSGNIPVYLELDYKNDVDFAIGLIGYTDMGFEQVFYSHVLTSSGDWNKVYLNMTEVLFNSQLTTYQVAFLAGLPDEVSQATITLDNIKLVHFK